jgi:drug/metabolite transporter (DMT)-like permease
VLHLLALSGVLLISFSAVFVRLATVSPVTVTFFRAAYAIPPLAILWLCQRADDRRGPRDRLVAFASGLVLAADLNVWHESIGLVGAGLGTVIPNVQVVFVAIAAWLFHRERPTIRRFGTIVLVAAGVVLASGLARDDSYGANPAAGVALGVVAGLCYAAYILVFRAATLSHAPPSGPLLDATIGMLVGALVCVPLDAYFTWTPGLMAHVWLALLALVSQVVGWLLIARAMPRLPAIETSILLLGQPVFAVIWGRMLFAERLSMLQWAGCALVLVGVGTLRTAD